MLAKEQSLMELMTVFVSIISRTPNASANTITLVFFLFLTIYLPLKVTILFILLVVRDPDG